MKIFNFFLHVLLIFVSLIYVTRIGCPGRERGRAHDGRAYYDNATKQWSCIELERIRHADRNVGFGSNRQGSWRKEEGVEK